MTGTLQRFSGYTYTALMAEDSELMRLMEVEARACALESAESEGW